MSECTRCGKCCRTYAIAMRRSEDYARFLSYHGLILRDRDDGQMEVYGEAKCRYLKSDPKDSSKYLCSIYDDRPNICRDWQCGRMVRCATSPKGG